MIKIGPGVFTFTGLIAGRVYAIRDSDGVTLIDAGIPIAAARIMKQLTQSGFQVSDIKRILITHAHPDHVGSIPALKKVSGAEVIISKLEAPVLAGEIPIPRTERRLRPPKTFLKNMKADRTLQDGDVLPEVMNGLQAIATPGHAPGHTAFWQPDQRLLFCGDTIFNIPRKMRLPPAFLTVDMAEDIRSIKKLAALEPTVICFGHGKPITHNAAQQLQAFANTLM